MAATLWGLFSGWLLFPYLGVPRMLRRAIALLLSLEFATITVWGFATEDCIRRPCSELSEATRVAAVEDLPALSVVVISLAVAHAVRRRRASLSRPDAAAAGARASRPGSR
jgi:hypothetical protein